MSSYLDGNGLARVWGKVKDFVNGKVQTDVPANAVFTDEKAKQENVTTNSEYRVLLSGSATNSTETATIKKSSKLKFKASSSELKIGDTESYGTTYHCELSPSEVGLYRKETQQSSSSTYTGLRMWRDSSTGEYDIQNSSTWDGTNDSLKDAISNLTDLATIDFAESSGVISVNGTYQIPDEVLAHTFIIIGARRQGWGNSAIFITANLLAINNGFFLPTQPNQGYSFKCSSTGLLTLTAKTSGVNEPFIFVQGIF